MGLEAMVYGENSQATQNKHCKFIGKKKMHSTWHIEPLNVVAANI